MSLKGNSVDVEADRIFIAAGCNRIIHNVSWGACDLVSFGSQNAVAIFCPKTAQILTTLPGHKSIVNCTRWVPNAKDASRVSKNDEHFVLSGSADGAIILWGMSLKERKWRKVVQVLQPHMRSVTCIVGTMISQTVAMLASTSSDGTIFIWEMVLPYCCGGDCIISCLQSITVGSKPMVALSIAELPGNTGHMVLAVGGLDNKVHLYCGERAGKFVHACELKGHTDWIRSLDFSLSICDCEHNYIFLVSASQDRSIRIWKIVFHGSLDNSEVTYRKEISLASYIEGPIFLSGTDSYQVSLESLLIGHEDWVYSVKWHPPLKRSEGNLWFQPRSILSASMDKTMMIWRPEQTTGIWVNAVTVGELSHCALGFYGGHWAPNGDSILAHGYGGSFHMWKNVGVDVQNWQPQVVPSGHFAAVTDLAWAKTGDYVLSVSCDQTTRIFTPWKKDGASLKNNSWHEIARPQVHGHDINCVAIISGKGNHRFLSGADEKVARVFEAPLSFLRTLNHAISKEADVVGDSQDTIQVLGANMSALGLSQKPIFVHVANETKNASFNDVSDSLETIPDAVPIVLTEPPIEEQLAWHTLWPESHKLYGHGNELFSLCCDHEGKLIASSCKAQTVSTAEIWLWEVGSWKAVGRLQSHSLTVTQIEFSHDDRFLLSVSRDRQFSVFSITRSEMGKISSQLIAKQEAHKRIIWTCSWNPCCHEFATGSRDKIVKIWAVHNESSIKQLMVLPQFAHSVTALSWSRCGRMSRNGLLAVGMEDGLIELWIVSLDFASPVLRFNHFLCHTSIVHRLAWKREDGDDNSSNSEIMQLASCGADHTVRVFQVTIKSL